MLPAATFEVMKGGTGLRLRSLVVTSSTTKVWCLSFGDDFVRQGIGADQNLRLFQILIETTGLDCLV